MKTMNAEETLRQIKSLEGEKNKINDQIDRLRSSLTIESTLFIKKAEDGMYRLAFYNHRVCVEFSYKLIVRATGVDQKDFAEKMREFNGEFRRTINDNWFEEDMFIFETREDAKRALEWINSVLIMNKLSE